MKEIIEKLPICIPFGYWNYGNEKSQLNVFTNHLIFLDLLSLICINADNSLIRLNARDGSYENYLLNPFFSDNNPEEYAKRIEKSFTVLDSEGVLIGKAVERRKDSFSFLNLDGFEREGLRGIIILKAVEVGQRSIAALQNKLVLPENIKLVPAKLAYQMAFMLSRFITEDFLKVFDLDRISIMSHPMEKLSQYDDELILNFSPHKKDGTKAKIGSQLFENPLTIGVNDGLCFLCYQSGYKEKFID